MARPRIAMSAEEAASFLAAKRVAVVGTVAADGRADADPATLAYEAGAITFRVGAATPAARNLRRDARVVCSVEEFPSYAEIRGVSVHGRAVLVADGSGEAVFRIADARIESFDFRKMRPRRIE